MMFCRILLINIHSYYNTRHNKTLTIYIYSHDQMTSIYQTFYVTPPIILYRIIVLQIEGWIENDFRLMSYFIDMIYVIIYVNPTVNCVRRLSSKELSKVSYY
jgi:hypothetical protein